jgi:DNA-binding beta-propeller fold protein YncE
MSIVQSPTAFLIAIAGLLAHGHARGPAVAFETKDSALTVRHPALYPETIGYDSGKDRFLLGSFRDGGIYEVDQEGRTSRLIDDPRLCSVLGIAIDAPRNRLWAVNSDLGASLKPSAAGPKKLAGVGIYDLSSGKAIHYVDLAALSDGPHLLNGIALDPQGNAYVTDSFSPRIYKVTSEGQASVFLEDARFAGAGVNLNGLVVHPDGYLLVVKKSDGILFKIPLDRPAGISKVAIDQTFIGGDGLTLIGKLDMVIVANRTPEHSSDAAFSLSSEDGWATAKVIARQPLGEVYPTTAVVRKGMLYLIHSKLGGLIAAPPGEKAKLKELARIRPIGRITIGR